jgi:hypothetical protein
VSRPGVEAVGRLSEDDREALALHFEVWAQTFGIRTAMERSYREMLSVGISTDDAIDFLATALLEASRDDG